MRFFIQQYQAILTASLVCVYMNLNYFNLSGSEFLERTETVAQKISVYLGLALLAASVLIPSAMAKVIYSHQKCGQLTTSKFQTAYGTLVNGLNMKSKNPQVPFWNVITLFRWGIQISVFVFLKDVPGIQIIINLIMSQLFTILISKVRPLEPGSEKAWIKINPNYFKILNEIMVTYYLIFMLLLTDITSDQDLRIAFGMGELAILGLCVFINVMKAALEGINEICRRRDGKNKTKLASKNYLEHTKIQGQGASQEMPSTLQNVKTKKFKKKNRIQRVNNKSDVTIVELEEDTPASAYGNKQFRTNDFQRAQLNYQRALSDDALRRASQLAIQQNLIAISTSTRGREQESNSSIHLTPYEVECEKGI
ncbi:hypothetical protein FGO68_gene9270 [Halteria grandinella]|uniref:TRP C-terminal domain-containing protein n=1 Tax=Halteria grandinella TaxID=5974 RepID=A0A8J8P4X0_HALGN|nr:hypothetical protein FGO68_gene9270 [Halteria grandinella]